MFHSLLAVFFLPLLLPAQSSQQALADELGAPVVRSGGGGPSVVTAAYSLFGDNCGRSCAALNDNRGTLRTGTLPNEYGFGYRFTQATTIVGFHLYTRTNTLPVASMTC